MMFLGTAYAGVPPMGPVDVTNDWYVSGDEPVIDPSNGYVYTSSLVCVEPAVPGDEVYCNQTEGCPMCVAMEQGLTCLTIEQNALGGTVANFPRGKIVMTAPARLPKVGTVNFRETTKEKLIDFWNGVQKQHGMKIRYKERMNEIERRKKGVFKVVTNKRSYLTHSILLAMEHAASIALSPPPTTNTDRARY